MVEISIAGWRDLNALRQLEKECFHDDAWPLLELIGVLTLPGNVRYKATVGPQMVGFVSGERRVAEGAAWITTIGVIPQYRRQGVAQALLDQAELDLNYPCIRLCVRRDNQPAINMYLKNGYQQVDIWAGYYSGKQDALVMEKKR